MGWLIYGLINMLISFKKLSQVGWEADKNYNYSEELNLINDSAQKILQHKQTWRNKREDSFSLYANDKKYQLIIYPIKAYNELKISKFNFELNQNKLAEIESAYTMFPIWSDPGIELFLKADYSNLSPLLTIGLNGDSINKVYNSDSLVVYSLLMKRITFCSGQDYDLILAGNFGANKDKTTPVNLAVMNRRGKFYLFLLFPYDSNKDFPNLLQLLK